MFQELYLDKPMLIALLYLYKGRNYPWKKVKQLIEAEFVDYHVFTRNEEQLQREYESN